LNAKVWSNYFVLNAGTGSQSWCSEALQYWASSIWWTIWICPMASSPYVHWSTLDSGHCRSSECRNTDVQFFVHENKFDIPKDGCCTSVMG
jgi:hypothetical protein